MRAALKGGFLRFYAAAISESAAIRCADIR